MDCSLPGSTVHGIFQARILEWVATSYSRESSGPRDQTHIPCIRRRSLELYHRGAGDLVVKSCSPLATPDCSLPGSTVHGILQGRILQRVAIFFSKGSSRPRNQTWVSCIVGRATREAQSWSSWFSKSFFLTSLWLFYSSLR